MALWFPSSLAKPLSPSTRESMVRRLPLDHPLGMNGNRAVLLEYQAYCAAHPISLLCPLVQTYMHYIIHLHSEQFILPLYRFNFDLCTFALDES